MGLPLDSTGSNLPANSIWSALPGLPGWRAAAVSQHVQDYLYALYRQVTSSPILVSWARARTVQSLGAIIPCRPSPLEVIKNGRLVSVEELIGLFPTRHQDSVGC